MKKIRDVFILGSLFIISNILLIGCSVKKNNEPLVTPQAIKEIDLNNYLLYTDDYLEYVFYYPDDWMTISYPLEEIPENPVIINAGENQEGFIYVFGKEGDISNFQEMMLIVSPNNNFESLDLKEYLNELNDVMHPLNWTQGIINNRGVQTCGHAGHLSQNSKPRLCWNV